jgi:CheY-like chemotaxis protein
MGHTILLADDSITIQKVIELTFSDEDFKLHTVSNGQKAIDEIRIVKPDIVLCDIIMPEKNGYEVCEFIKSNGDLKHIPVLLLTGAFEPFDQERARQAGCDGFLAKPFEPQTLISKVRELLATAKKGATATVGAPTQPAAGAPRPAPPKSAAAPPPPAAPPRAATPPPPPAPADATVVLPFEQQSPGPAAASPPDMEDFAYEMGDRELAVDPGDRNLLIEPEEGSQSAGSEDIWGQVQDASPARGGTAGAEDEGATLMMQTPLSLERPSEEGFGGGAGFDELVVPEPTFESPPEMEVTPEPAEPELTPMGDFGFDAFAATDQGGASEAPPGDDVGEATMMFTEPPAAATETPWESAESAGSSWPEAPASSSWEAGAEAPEARWQEEAVPLSPAWEEPEAPAAANQTPTWEEPAVPAEAWEDAVPAATWEEAAPSSGAPARVGASPAPQPGAPTAPGSPPAQKPEPAPATSVSGGGPAAGAGLDAQQLDDLAERVAQKIVSKISAKVIQEIAWEVVPDLAETLIRKEIEALKAKIPH